MFWLWKWLIGFFMLTGLAAGGYVALDSAQEPRCVVQPGVPVSVPEPGTIILLGTGLTAIAFVSRKRLFKK